MLKIANTQGEKDFNSTQSAFPTKEDVVRTLKETGKMVPVEQLAPKDHRLRELLKTHPEIKSCAQVGSGADTIVYIYENQSGETDLVKIYRPSLSNIVATYGILTQAAISVLPEVSEQLNHQVEIDGDIYNIEYTATPFIRSEILNKVTAIYPEWIRGENWHKSSGSALFPEHKDAIALEDISRDGQSTAFLLHLKGEARAKINQMLGEVGNKLGEALDIDEKAKVMISRINIKGKIDHTKRKILITITDLHTIISQMKPLTFEKWGFA